MSGFDVDAVREARKWLVERVYNGKDNLTVADTLFLSWYAQGNHGEYTVYSAYNYFYDGNDTRLVLRSEEGEMPSPEVSGQGAFRTTHE